MPHFPFNSPMNSQTSTKFYGDGFNPTTNQKRLQGHFRQYTPLSNPYVYLRDPNVHQTVVESSGFQEGVGSESALWMPPEQPLPQIPPNAGLTSPSKIIRSHLTLSPALINYLDCASFWTGLKLPRNIFTRDLRKLVLGSFSRWALI